LIQDVEGKPFDQPARSARLRSRIERAVSGGMRPPSELAARPSHLPKRTEVFRVEPLVLIDNSASNTHTVIEVNGRDRPRLLSDVAQALFELNLSISSAHIETYGERAVDVFYVKDLFGLKITNEGKLAKIKEGLLAAVAEPKMKKTGDKPAKAKKPRRKSKPNQAVNAR
jgi:[protein-PII] uridylyltransferase